MKFLVILFIGFFSFNAHVQTTGGDAKKVNQLLEQIESNKFLKDLDKIKSFKSLAHISELDYGLKKYYKNIKSWYYFDSKNYKKVLFSKIKNNFSNEELDILLSKLNNPFYVKFLKAMSTDRDIFMFHKDLLTEDFKLLPIPESRSKVLESIFNIHGMEIQENNAKERLEYLSKSKKIIVKMLSNSSSNEVYIDPIMIDERHQNLRQFMMVSLANDLKAFRHYEVREYLRISKSPIVQKFIQLYVNYHFLYITKYIRNVENSKIDQLKSLKL
jgi:hypothetical protein